VASLHATAFGANILRRTAFRVSHDFAPIRAAQRRRMPAQTRLERDSGRFVGEFHTIDSEQAIKQRAAAGRTIPAPTA